MKAQQSTSGRAVAKAGGRAVAKAGGRAVAKAGGRAVAKAGGRAVGKAGRITTHVLDTATGQPVSGMAVVLRCRCMGGEWEVLATASTDADGRLAAPLIEGEAMRAAEFEILFLAGAWRGGQPGFYDTIPVRFLVSDPAAHHHVPLILSAFGYSTYRGS